MNLKLCFFCFSIILSGILQGQTQTTINAAGAITGWTYPQPTTNFVASGSGSAYALTSSLTNVVMGTNPVLVITQPGTYNIAAIFSFKYNACTIGASQTVNYQLERTNNIPGPIHTESYVLPLQPVTVALTGHISTETILCSYTTSNTNDAIWAQASCTGTLTGNVQIDHVYIVAQQTR